MSSSPFVFRGHYRKKIQSKKLQSMYGSQPKNSRFENMGEAVAFLKNRIRRIMHLLRWFAELKK